MTIANTSNLDATDLLVEHNADGTLRSKDCRAYHNAAQAVTTATFTVLALNSERYDTDGIHDTVTNNSRLTCKTAGKYIITGNVEFAANATGFRIVQIYLNGATTIAYQIELNPTAGGLIEMTISTLYSLALNDFVELRVYQNSGGNLNVTSAANYSPEFAMSRVGS